jgi:hypothetical protein
MSRAWSRGQRAWSKEHGAESKEHGAWSKEHGAWGREAPLVGALDGRPEAGDRKPDLRGDLVWLPPTWILGQEHLMAAIGCGEFLFADQATERNADRRREDEERNLRQAQGPKAGYRSIEKKLATLSLD